MKNIGILVYDVSLTGGAENVAINLSEELSKKHNVFLISIFDKLGYFPSNAVTFYNIECETKSLTFNLLHIAKKLRKYIKDNNIEIIMNITAGVNTVSLLATAGLDSKTIYCEHSNLYNQTYGKKHIFRQWLGAKYCDYVIALTESDKDEFIRRYNIKNKCDYIYNWYESKNNRNTYDENSKSIISVGRLEKVKGYDRLIEVAKIVLKENPDWVWNIYGSGSQKEKLEKLIIENELDKNVFLKGNVSNILDLYSEHAFLVLTSYYEGLPLVLLEAQTHNLPIVSFDCHTGPSEIITDSVNGFLIDNGNIKEMANKINLLIKDETLRCEFSNNATINIYKFEKKQIIEKWFNLIEKV
ncbi:MAG: glycosyltransferase family 4 protein [Bacillota bacterium]|nr:glycosyltransferase family 4 protein [Bacillota bacterium]